MLADPVLCPFCGSLPDNTTDIRRDRWSHQCPKTQGLRVWWNRTHWSSRQEMAILHLRQDVISGTDAKVIPFRA